jgi:hypothetical protein
MPALLKAVTLRTPRSQDLNLEPFKRRIFKDFSKKFIEFPQEGLPVLFLCYFRNIIPFFQTMQEFFLDFPIWSIPIFLGHVLHDSLQAYNPHGRIAYPYLGYIIL